MNQIYKSLSLKQNFSWTFAGNLINLVSLWAIVALVTKIGNVHMVGMLELARSIAWPIMMLTMLQLRAVQITDTENKYAFSDYFGTRIFTSFIGLLIFFMITSFFYNGSTAKVIMLWGMAKCIDSISDIIRGLFQRYERMNISGISFMIRSPAAFVAMALLLLLTDNLPIAIGGICVTWLIVLILFDLKKAKNLLSQIYNSKLRNYLILPRFNLEIIFSLLWTSFPLGLVLFIGALQMNVPKLILESYHGETALGYFGPLIYPIMTSTLLVSAIGQAATPRLANYFSCNIRKYCKLLKKLLIVGLVIGIIFFVVIVLFGKYILTIMYTYEYSNFHTDLIILSGGGVVYFLNFFCGYALTAAHVFRKQLIISLISCSVTITASFLLIPIFGIRGTSFTFALFWIINSLLYFYVLLSEINKKQSQDK